MTVNNKPTDSSQQHSDNKPQLWVPQRKVINMIMLSRGKLYFGHRFSAVDMGLVMLIILRNTSGPFDNVFCNVNSSYYESRTFLAAQIGCSPSGIASSERRLVAADIVTVRNGKNRAVSFTQNFANWLAIGCSYWAAERCRKDD